MPDEEPREIHMTVHRRPMQRSLSVLVLDRHIGAVLDEEPCKIQMTMHRRPMQRSRADRKSTRLNYSHLVTSYAVFCLKKKKSHSFPVLQLPLYNSYRYLTTALPTY